MTTYMVCETSGLHGGHVQSKVTNDENEAYTWAKEMKVLEPQNQVCIYKKYAYAEVATARVSKL